MKYQHGIAEGWLIGIIAVIGLLAVTNAITWHVSATYTESGWQAREAKINAESADKIAKANDKVRQAEQAHAKQLNAVDTTFQGKLREKDHALTAALNTVRSGGLFVRASCPPVAGNAGPQAGASAGIGDGGTRAKLSDADSDFLLKLGSEADKIVEQLTAAQTIIMAQIRTCNGSQ